MTNQTYDYAAPEKRLMERIEAELDARTPEEIGGEQEQCRRSFQDLVERHIKFWVSHKNVGNKQKIKDFLAAATVLRRFTGEHTGVIEISVEESWVGKIEMRFDALFFMDGDATGSHEIFAGIFQKFRDVTISPKGEQVVIQIFDDLYDVVEAPVPEEPYSPS